VRCEAVRWIAQLGGFLGRKHDGEPGVSVLWKGFQHLVDTTAMYQIMRPASPSSTRRTQNKDSG
jgi:Transposase Tn5 dimerisation domain